jgi:hypothetical protein
MIRDIAADVAAYSASLTVEDEAGRVWWMELARDERIHSITPLLRYCIGLRRFVRWRGPALD